MCNSLEDGKKVVDAHLGRDRDDPADYTVVVSLILVLAILAAVFFGT